MCGRERVESMNGDGVDIVGGVGGTGEEVVIQGGVCRSGVALEGGVEALVELV